MRERKTPEVLIQAISQIWNMADTDITDTARAAVIARVIHASDCLLQLALIGGQWQIRPTAGNECGTYVAIGHNLAMQISAHIAGLSQPNG